LLWRAIKITRLQQLKLAVFLSETRALAQHYDVHAHLVTNRCARAAARPLSG
jgi:hypothetical protein